MPNLIAQVSSFLHYKKKLNMKPDLFQSPDYYLLDDLLSEEHKLVRDSDVGKT
jgi:glutaryl-CoA dehydrogenase